MKFFRTFAIQLRCWRWAPPVRSRSISPSLGDIPATDPDRLPAQFVGVGIEEHLGRTIDLDLTFNDEDGKLVKLRDFFNKGRPVLLDRCITTAPICAH